MLTSWVVLKNNEKNKCEGIIFYTAHMPEL
jgi:hypothetical protein